MVVPELNFIRKIAHKVVINIVKQCISKNSTLSLGCCSIHFQKYPLFFFLTTEIASDLGLTINSSDILIK